jgi:hypothetical protein
MWMQEGKTNELIARTIRDLWGKCNKKDLPWLKFIGVLSDFRRETFAATAKTQTNQDAELLFDPLAENASLVKDLRAEYEEWTEKAKGDPSKAVFEHLDRLGRLLGDTIANHASIQSKINGGSGPEKKGGSKVDIGTLNMVYNSISGDEMPEFFETVKAQIELSAKPLIQSQARQLVRGKGRSIKEKRLKTGQVIGQTTNAD